MLLLLSSRYVIKNDPVPKSFQWFTEVLPALDDRRFKSVLRTTRFQFGFILDIIQDSPVFAAQPHQQFSVSHQLAIALFKLGHYGNAASVTKVAAKFGIGDGGTVLRCTNRVIKVSKPLVTCLIINLLTIYLQALLAIEKEFIFWPSEEERLILEKESAHELPLCIGYLDGTEIKLAETPALDHTSYYSRKSQYSVKVQVR